MAQTETLKQIKIEREIPLPKYTKMPIRNDLAEDIKKMKPLDSRLIDVEFNKKNLNAVRTRVHGILEREGLKENRKYTVNFDPVTKQQNEKNPSVKVLLRIWRIL